MSKDIEKLKITSPCCNAPVKEKVVEETAVGNISVFICQKDKKEIEPHFLIREDYPKKQVEQIKESFKKSND